MVNEMMEGVYAEHATKQFRAAGHCFCASLNE
jgi:hypothetical protein